MSEGSWEGIYSKLELIFLIVLRSTMRQSRLSDVAIASTESDTAKSVNFHEVFQDKRIPILMYRFNVSSLLISY